VDWGKVNKAIAPERFEALLERVTEHLRDRDLFVRTFTAAPIPPTGCPFASSASTPGTRCLCASSLSGRGRELATHVPEFTVIAAPEFEAVPERDGTHSGAFILADFTRKIILIGGTKYAGEMKKSIFGVMNFLVPQKARRAAHALLGQRGRGRRFGALLRPLGNRQDHALGRPGRR
jgi:phosphoenolpyruvate carboxykinase (ATP)